VAGAIVDERTGVSQRWIHDAKEAVLMTTVFVSYGRENDQAVRSLAHDLDALGHSIWFDQALTGGRAWWDHILGRIRDSDVFLFALSPESLDSEACRQECSYAFKLGKTVLPVLVADGIKADLLPPMLAQIQYVDYRGQDKSAVFSLMKAFDALPPLRPMPDPLPDPPAIPMSYLGSLMEQITVATPLPFGEQTALVVRLKQGLRDPKTADSARDLLLRLRARDDLFARVAEEIDQLLSVDRPRPRPPEPESTRAASNPRVAPAATRGRLLRVVRWLLCIDEMVEHAALQRQHLARVRSEPSLATALRWVFGDQRQWALRVRIVIRLALLLFAFGALIGIIGNMRF
jgi:hypothetical protein